MVRVRKIEENTEDILNQHPLKLIIRIYLGKVMNINGPVGSSLSSCVILPVVHEDWWRLGRVIQGIVSAMEEASEERK